MCYETKSPIRITCKRSARANGQCFYWVPCRSCKNLTLVAESPWHHKVIIYAVNSSSNMIHPISHKNITITRITLCYCYMQVLLKSLALYNLPWPLLLELWILLISRGTFLKVGAIFSFILLFSERTVLELNFAKYFLVESGNLQVELT